MQKRGEFTLRLAIRDIVDWRHWFEIRKCNHCGKEYRSQVATELRNPKLLFLLALLGVTLYIVVKRLIFGR